MVWERLTTWQEFIDQGPSGRELAYAENLAGAATVAAAGPAYGDVPGLSINFVVGARPVVVRASGPVIFSNVVGSRVRTMLTDAANAQITYSQVTIQAASEHHPVGLLQWRFPAGAGAKTVKLRFGVFSGAAVSTTLLTTGGGAIWLQANEV